MSRKYEEIEFRCANSNFPAFDDILDKHMTLYAQLKRYKGLVAYRQDFSEGEHKQLSFAVIILDQKLKPLVMEKAFELDLSVDTINHRDDTFVDAVTSRRLESILPDSRSKLIPRR